MAISYNEVIEKYDCTMIDKTIYDIINDSYEKKKFGFTSIENNHQTIVYMLLNFDVEDRDTLAGISMLPMVMVEHNQKLKYSDEVYCIVSRVGDSILSRDIKRDSEWANR